MIYKFLILDFSATRANNMLMFLKTQFICERNAVLSRFEKHDDTASGILYL
jgi:hypothetical protein